jgi:hypothetical protein
LTPAAPLAAAIFLMTVGLIIARPKRLTEASAALLGACAMVLAGLVPLGAAAADLAGHWNVLSFFLGLTGSAAVAERRPHQDRRRIRSGSRRSRFVAVPVIGDPSETDRLLPRYKGIYHVGCTDYPNPTYP